MPPVSTRLDSNVSLTTTAGKLLIGQLNAEHIVHQGAEDNFNSSSTKDMRTGCKRHFVEEESGDGDNRETKKTAIEVDESAEISGRVLKSWKD